MAHSFELLRELLLQRLPPLRRINSGWQIANCPFCVYRGYTRDTRRRFGMLPVTDTHISLHCFNCNLNAKWVPGSYFSRDFKNCLHNLGVSTQNISQIEILTLKEKKEGQLQSFDNIKSVIKVWEEIKLPTSFKKLSEYDDNDAEDEDFLSIINYASERRIRDLGELYWCSDKQATHQMSKRLIIPYYHNGNIVGYVGRYYTDDVNFSKDKIYKYYGSEPKDFVYNLSNQNLSRRKIVTVHEGVLDAYQLDGIGLMSASIKDEQRRQIDRLNKTIIFCPDRDSNGAVAVEEAIKYNWCVSFPPWEKDIKDAAQACERYGRLATLKSIIDNAVSSPFTIRFRRKKDVYVPSKRGG